MKTISAILLLGIAFSSCATQKYRIAWKSSYTGYKGHGKWHKEDFMLTQYVKGLNMDYPGIRYWVEPKH